MTMNKNIETERIKDGVYEHRHDERNYWHPAARIHSGKVQQVIKSAYQQTSWKIGVGDICNIIEGLNGQQLSYTDECGKLQFLPTNSTLYDMIPKTGNTNWAQDISRIPGIMTTTTFHNGKLVTTILESKNGLVQFHEDYVTYDVGSRIHNAKILIETGVAAKYIKHPDLLDALHILHVANQEEGYYDLIKLPDGQYNRFIPVRILEDEYKVSWEILVKIPLGKPRDNNTFECPICGQKSYYVGICNSCLDVCCDCPEWDCDHCCDHCDRCVDRHKIDKWDVVKNIQSGIRHREILQLIESGDWKNCRYIRG